MIKAGFFGLMISRQRRAAWPAAIRFLATISLGLPWLLSAQDSPVPRFESDIAPILAENCFACHGENLQQAELDVRTRDALLAGGKSGPAIVPGTPVDSLLLQKTASGAMPMGDKKLAPGEIELIRRCRISETSIPDRRRARERVAGGELHAGRWFVVEDAGLKLRLPGALVAVGAVHAGQQRAR